MFQDLVLAIFIVSCHRGMYMLIYILFNSCPRDRRFIIMAIKVSPIMSRCHAMKKTI